MEKDTVIEVESSQPAFLEHKIFGIDFKWFLLFCVIVFTSMALGVVPTGIGGGFIFGILLGGLLDYLGDHLPIIKDYLGGGSVMIIFGAAALATFNIIPTDVQGMMEGFFQGDTDYINFALSIFICASIMGTDKTVLKKASVRFVPTVIGAQITAMIFVAIISLVLGENVLENVMYIAIPITAGGMSAGAIPLSQIYEANLDISADTTLSIMAPSIALANATAIILAGIISNLVSNKPKLTGYGKIMPTAEGEVEEHETPFISNYKQLTMGFLVCFSLLIVAQVINSFFPQFHAYAYMVIICIIVKLTGVLGQENEDSIGIFYESIVPVLRVVMLTSIGVTMIDLREIAALLSPSFFIVVILCVLGAFLGAAAVGRSLGLFPVEAGISAGLCAADMGGTGDLGILGAANRMELLPFATIATRIGGAIILIIGSIVTSLVG